MNTEPTAQPSEEAREYAERIIGTRIVGVKVQRNGTWGPMRVDLYLEGGVCLWLETRHSWMVDQDGPMWHFTCDPRWSGDNVIYIERDDGIDNLTPDELNEYVRIQEKLLNNRERLLDAIPPCPVHGPNCIEHALEWIKEHTPVEQRYRNDPTFHHLTDWFKQYLSRDEHAHYTPADLERAAMFAVSLIERERNRGLSRQV